MDSRHSSRVISLKISHHCPVCLIYDRLKLSSATYSNRANFDSKKGDIAFGCGLQYFEQKIEVVAVPLREDIHNIIKAFVLWWRLNVLGLQYGLNQFISSSFHIGFS